MNNLEIQTEQRKASGIETNLSLKARILRALGFSSSGLGTFGAAHNVCHYTCQTIVALLAIAGISIAGMPLGFLLNPHLIITFSIIGFVSVALSIIMQTRLLKLSGSRIFRDKKVIIASVFGVLSVISLISGINDIRATEQTVSMSNTGANLSNNTTLAVDAPTKTNNNGTIDATVTFGGLSQEELLFEVTTDTTDMGAPPLAEQYDLQKLSLLIVDDTITVKPIRWDIKEAGHMGHHLKGTLIFPAEERGQKFITDQTEAFEIQIKNLGGITQRSFSWKVVR